MPNWPRLEAATRMAEKTWPIILRLLSEVAQSVVRMVKQVLPVLLYLFFTVLRMVFVLAIQLVSLAVKFVVQTLINIITSPMR